MKAMAKRLAHLEARAGDLDLAHLTDDELDARTLDAIQRVAGAGVALPEDWREQFDRSSARFLEWMCGEVREALACEA